MVEVERRGKNAELSTAIKVKGGRRRES